MTRVLHLIHSGAVGGGPAVVLELAARIPADHVIMAPDDGPLLEKARAATIETRILPRAGKYSFAFSIPRAAREMRWADLVHLHGQFAGMYGAIAAGLAGRPAIYTAHFPSFVTDEGVLTTARNHIAELVTCRFSTMIVSCSQSMADEFLRRRLIPPAKIMTIYNGVSETHVGHSPEHLRTELSIPADHQIILAVGRFTRQKGFDLLLDAAAPLLEDLGATTVILLGDGEERNRLESQARKLGIGDRVRFTGFRGDTAEFYALADTVVVPSRYEIFPLVPLEAMMAEKPVVASDLPVLREALEPDRTGIVVPNTPASLYGALRRVLTCPEWARELAAAARSVALDRFSAGRMADEYRRLYESVAGAAA